MYRLNTEEAYSLIYNHIYNYLFLMFLKYIFLMLNLSYSL